MHVEVPEDPAGMVDLAALPNAPGLFAFEDVAGGTIALAVTANVRRMVRERLRPRAAGDAPTRQVDYRAVTRHVRAMRIASGFEGDWAYLQLARRRLPTTYGRLLERWRGWFLECDPEATFPRFVATSDPDADRPETVLGPLPDRAVAEAVIEALEETFDLCRYYHILREAPHGAACAYKEMGKCPAPCDGTISMDAYRGSVRDAFAFAGDAAGGRAALEQAMQDASRGLDFERAERIRRRLEASEVLDDARTRFIDALSRFRFVACMPSERAGYARIFVIAGGWIEPWADVPADADPAAWREIVAALERRLADRNVALDAEARENVGLVCRALFAPDAKRAGVLLRAPVGEAHEDLAAAIRAVGGASDESGDQEIRDAVIDARPPEAPGG
jgi:DNA polymerase-3 subunit epsilon